MTDGWTSNPASLPPVAQAFKVSRDTLIMQWREMAKQLDAVKAAEINLRNAVIAECFPTIGEGTERFQLGMGYELKAVGKINYTVDKKTIDAALDAVSKASAEGAFIADRVIKWKPELSVTEWRELDARYKTLLAGSVTEKPGATSLELVEPKVK